MPLQVAGDGFAQLARTHAVNDLYLFEIAHNRPVDKIIDLVQRLGNGHAEKVDFKLRLRRCRRISVSYPDFTLVGQFCALFWRIYLLQVGNFAPRLYAAADNFDLAPGGIYGEHLSGRLKFYKENIVSDVKIFSRLLNGFKVAYDGSAMRQVNAAEILDIAMAGTSATLLAKRWESALLVNVDNETLARLLANQDAMDALMRIEGFRSLNDDIQTIINKSEAVKKAKKESDKLTPKQKKELSEEEKEYKSKRKMIQEKLIKFATRVPVFMYLTDYREYSLKDVITQLEPELFKKVTGLDVKDFELLVSLNVFNEALMNDAVYKFKRYEDASLSYTGIDRHAGESIGLYSTVLTRQDYDMMAGQLVSSEEAPALSAEDVPDAPYFGADTTTAEEDEDEIPEPEPKPQPSRRAGRNPVVTTTIRRDIVPPAQPTYHPAFVPPVPAAPEPPKAVPQVDVSDITAGSAVVHKAFGAGVVQNIDKGLITVSFGGLEKKFQFPGAFQQGFLRKA